MAMEEGAVSNRPNTIGALRVTFCSMYSLARSRKSIRFTSRQSISHTLFSLVVPNPLYIELWLLQTIALVHLDSHLLRNYTVGCNIIFEHKVCSIQCVLHQSGCEVFQTSLDTLLV